VNWVTEDWRLKLLAVGLAVLMLGAVAFSQNPPTSRTMQVGIAYTVPDGLILVNPPTKTTVTVSGLADLVSAASSNNVVTTADISKVNPGTGVKVSLVPKTTIPNVSIQTTPVVLNIDQRAVVKLSVVVRTPKGAAPGWQVTKMEARCPDAPCSVSFDGPVSVESNLKAYADFPIPVDGSYDFPSQQVVLEQNGIPLELPRLVANTQPKSSLDINAVNIHIEAKSGTTSRQVTLVDSPPANPPPNCYRVTNIAVDPISVVVTGPPDALATVTRITLPARPSRSRFRSPAE
jgi:YbbR domain-containing protein